MQRRISSVVIAVFAIFLITPAMAKGMKGTLEKEEHGFISNTITPILIKNGICKKIKGDCNDGYIYCISVDFLSCDVYGISDEKVMKEIIIAVLNSGLDVYLFKFWKSKYHQTSLFEKPLLEYINRMRLNKF